MLKEGFAFDYRAKRRLAHELMASLGLEHPRSLYPTGEIYLFTQEREPRVFKVGFSGDGRDRRHILPEARALEVLAGNDVLRTPSLHSMGVSEIRGYSALYIIKEYVEGETLDLSEGGATQEAYDALEQGIKEAHRLGVANLDIFSCNIIVRPDGTLQFFEYSGVRFRDPQPGLRPQERLWSGNQEFTRYERKDWIDFEKTRERLQDKGKLSGRNL